MGRKRRLETGGCAGPSKRHCALGKLVDDLDRQCGPVGGDHRSELKAFYASVYRAAPGLRKNFEEFKSLNQVTVEVATAPALPALRPAERRTYVAAFMGLAYTLRRLRAEAAVAQEPEWKYGVLVLVQLAVRLPWHSLDPTLEVLGVDHDARFKYVVGEALKLLDFNEEDRKTVVGEVHAVVRKLVAAQLNRLQAAALLVAGEAKCHLLHVGRWAAVRAETPNTGAGTTECWLSQRFVPVRETATLEVAERSGLVQRYVLHRSFVPLVRAAFYHVNLGLVLAQNPNFVTGNIDNWLAWVAETYEKTGDALVHGFSTVTTRLSCDFALSGLLF